jgi:hypothetical protein
MIRLVDDGKKYSDLNKGLFKEDQEGNDNEGFTNEF